VQIYFKMSWISQLQNPHLRKRHWDALCKISGMNLKDDTLAIKELLNAGNHQYAKIIEEISLQASKEFIFEAELNAIELSWKDISLPLILDNENNDDQQVQIGDTTEIKMLLEDSLTRLMALSVQNCAKPIKLKFEKWKSTLEAFVDTLVRRI